MMKRLRPSSVLALAGWLVALPTFADADGVVEKRLINGLTIISREVRTAPVAAFSIWYRTGSRNERPGITGVSHLLEHMMFKGTRQFGKGEISRLLTKNGAAFNAGTSDDYTVYYETLASDRLELALRIESDRMRNSLILPSELRAEMTVVRSELEGDENEPEEVLRQAVLATAYQTHPYRWPTIGWRSDVEAITVQDIRRYYNTYYQPNDAFIVAVGDFDTAWLHQKVEHYFGSIPSGGKLPQVRTVEPRQRGERRIVVRREGNTAYVRIVFHTPHILNEDNYALAMLDQILSGGRSARLYSALVQTGLATSASSSSGVARDPSLFSLTATVKQGVPAARVESALLEEIERLKREPVPAHDMQQARNQIEAYFTFEKDGVSNQMFRLGYFAAIQNWRYGEHYLNHVRRVTPADIRRVAERYLTADNRTVGYYEPIPVVRAAATSVPPRPRPLALESIPWEQRVVAYRATDKAEVEPAPVTAGATAPVPLRPVRQLVRPYHEVLDNGIVLIVQENHSNTTVAVTGSFRGGTALEPRDRPGLAGFTAAMLSRGTHHRNWLDIARATEFVAASVTADAGIESSSFAANCLTKDFTATMDVLADMLRHPSFPEDQLDRLRGQRLSALERAMDDPSARAQRAMSRAIYPAGHPYRPAAWNELVESCQTISRADLIAFHDKVYIPDAMIIVIVGDVTPEQASAEVHKVFGDWPRSGRAADLVIPSLPTRAAPIRQVITMPARSQVDAFIGWPGTLRRQDSDYHAAVVMNFILGSGGALTSRLGGSIRDEHGLAYNVYSTFRASFGPGTWYAYLGVDPQHVDTAVDVAFKEIARCRDKGVTSQELEDAVDYITGSYPLRLATNAGVANALETAEFYGLGMNYLDDFIDLYKGVTLAEVNAAARKCLHPESAVVVIAGPYASKAEDGCGVAT